MQFGMNLLLWTDDATGAAWLPLCARLAALGFDGVELPIFERDPARYRALGRQLEELGLERTAVTICRPEADPIHPDAAVRRRAVDELRRAVDCCEAAGVRLLGGPCYAAIGRFSGEPPNDDERRRSADVLREVADHAAAAGVALGLEFLNRFEIYLLNCAEDAARLAREVGRPNVGVHYDSFHAHIEEKSVSAALGACADRLVHVHVSESDRSTPGQGQVAWRETFDSLARIGYDGWLTIEAFGRGLPALAAATKIWRKLYASEEQLAAEGLAFLRAQWARAAAAPR